METPQAAAPQQPPPTPYGTTFERGVHFYQGILTYEGERWLIYPSEREFKRFDAGQVKVFKLRPARSEAPYVMGDQLRYAHRFFYRDPVLNWTDQPPPKSLKTYLETPKFRRFVKRETDLDTEVRARFEHQAGWAENQAKQTELSEIPQDLWADVMQGLPTKSHQKIAEELSTPELTITEGQVRRLHRHFIRNDLYKAHKVKLENEIAADQLSLEQHLAKAESLLELSSDRVVKQSTVESAELRKNASLYFEMAKFDQKRIAANERKLEDITMGHETEKRRVEKPTPAEDPRDKKIAALEAKVAELTALVEKLTGKKAEPPKPADPKAEEAPIEEVGDPTGFDTTPVRETEATSSPPEGEGGVQ